MHYLRLIGISFVSLFLELLIIRLLSTEVRIFAYFSNLILLGVFVGFGIGMLIRRKIPILISAITVFLLIISISSHYIIRFPNLEFRFLAGITELLAPLSESYIWLQIGTYSKLGIGIGLLLLVLVFIGTILIFLPLGHILGEELSRHKNPLKAYSVNIAASLLGMWSFQLFSVLRLSPYFGVALVLAALLFFIRERNEKLFVLGLSVILLAFITPKVKPEVITVWSPYQKLSLSVIRNDPNEPKPQPEGWYLEVNNVGYMSLLNLSDEYHKKAEKKTLELFGSDATISAQFTDQYTLPFSFVKNPNRVLIIGSGGGNDVAGALRAVKNNKEAIIDAVEIDPVIVEFGARFHHERPYSDPKVRVTVDDGRAFMQRADKTYDLVVMGLADSHTLSSSLTNLRLDHYLYTTESFAQVKNILADKGVLFLTFEVTRPWMGERLFKGLSDVFQQKPIIFDVRSNGIYGWGGYAFVVSKNPKILENILSQNNNLRQFINDHAKKYNEASQPLTDNWPYLYLDKPRLPILHLITSIILGGVLLFVGRKLKREKTIDFPMFLWGAAFLLFEFQNVSKTSLLFGVTWITNLFTISAILIFLLLANWVVQKKLIPEKIAFVFLILSLLMQMVLPLYIFNTLSLWQKVIFGSLFLNIPLFFGGIIFAEMFRAAKNKAHAFGSNFLGSVLGGFLETISFLFGITPLLYLITILYAAGYFLYRQGKNR